MTIRAALWFALGLAWPGCAWAAGSVPLLMQPDIGKDAAAFPRLAPGEPQAARINRALAAADARAGRAAAECFADGSNRPEMRKNIAWTRKITATMRGPGYLALVTDDYSYCGGAYPNADSIALTYDLHTGRPVNWAAVLPRALVDRVSVETAMDATPLGMVASDALAALYLEVAHDAIAKVDARCMDTMEMLAGPFMLWPDARQGGLGIRPSRPAHAFAACAVPGLIPLVTLRARGVAPPLLQMIAAGHQVGR